MLIESVPNFSEGRRSEVMAAIADAARIDGVKVLGMEGDPDHNRSVLTVVGEPQALVEAIFRAAQVAVTHINLHNHHGTHPRMGAIDVVPFIPLQDATMEDAVDAARKLGRRFAQDLNIPVYLYEQAATKPERKNLADVRRGQFEGLSQRMVSDPPDFGPAHPHPTAGASAIGARLPLIAFNVFLNTTDMTVARNVARAVRGSSGGLVGIKALAMNTVSHGQVQVSLNLVDYPKTPLPRALEMIRQEAMRYGVTVSHTELVGFMPAQAILDTVRYYLQQPEFRLDQILEWAIMADSSLEQP
ncbi:MAG: glutamate formimidoyltransferase [Sulfobacillus thermosulfidooxidans]|uniref:glutamate formimidoyltransferase n=1 Tax=Sulfobacillus thermosulfidooxidans TaxID=28034 RepID=A0A2T2X115_SULTH|nr:MAG: glutamate formimidoyltransferase [Sulfobacillus thermosulfidooxidans]